MAPSTAPTTNNATANPPAPAFPDGPYVISGPGIISTDGDDATLICDVYAGDLVVEMGEVVDVTFGPRSEATTRLLRAAPEMFDCLTRLLPHIQGSAAFHGYAEGHPFRVLCNKAQEVLNTVAADIDYRRVLGHPADSLPADEPFGDQAA